MVQEWPSIILIIYFHLYYIPLFEIIMISAQKSSPLLGNNRWKVRMKIDQPLLHDVATKHFIPSQKPKTELGSTHFAREFNIYLPLDIGQSNPANLVNMLLRYGRIRYET